MSDRQTTDFEENIGLVGFTIKKFFPQLISDDDLYQVGLIGLWKATEKFNKSKAAFSTFAIKCIRNEVIMELRRRDRKDRLVPLSLDAPVLGLDDSGSGIVTYMESSIVTDDSTLPNNVDIELRLKELFTKLNARDARILELRLQGYTLSEIGEDRGVNTGRTTVLNRLNYIKEVLNENVLHGA